MTQSIPEPLQGVATGLHHVAIAVHSLEEARKLYVDSLGLRALEPEHVAIQKVNVQVLFAGDQRIELVEPAADDSPITKYLAKRGEGIHHMAWSVDDCAAALAILAARGIRLIDEVPKIGAHETITAFLHPKATAGVLMELVQDPNAQ
ncbi:MAG: methylmalonyl-CoA/ethylmalonyl-CoA epimerase [Planctomycetota bacterium]|jgi:methylmalonyl-CoA/ethylmalonyl-CoA epimerase